MSGGHRYAIVTAPGTEQALFTGLRATVAEDAALGEGRRTDFGVPVGDRTEPTRPLSQAVADALRGALERRIVEGRRTAPLVLNLAEPLGLRNLKQIEALGGRLVRPDADPAADVRMLHQQNLVRILHHAEQSLPPAEPTPGGEGEPNVVVLDEEASLRRERLRALQDNIVSAAAAQLAQGLRAEDIIPDLARIGRGEFLNDILLGAAIEDAQADIRDRRERSAVARAWRYALTPAAIAERFAGEYAAEVVYVPELDLWRVWNGIVWEDDPAQAEVTERLKGLILSVSSEAEGQTDAETMQKIADRKIAPLLSNGGLRGVLSLAARLPRLQRSATGFDADPYLLNLQNTTLDLRTGTAKFHDPGDYITRVAGRFQSAEGSDYVRYDPNATCPLWERCLVEWFPGEGTEPDRETIAALQERAGYWLSGIVKEAEYTTFFSATGRNGKGVFKNTLLSLAGDYGAVADPGTFVRRGGESKGGARGDLGPLMGARLVFASEPAEGDRLDEAFIKQVTGGDDVTFRPPYGRESISFKPTFKLVLLTNHLLAIRGADSIWDRQRLIVWRRRFEEHEQDRDLEAKLTAELPGILNWCVEGFARYERRGRLQESSSMREARNRYRTSQTPNWLEWVEDRCVLAREVQGEYVEKVRIHKPTLYIDYAQWCAENDIEGRERLGRNKFYAALVNRYNLTEINSKGVGRVLVGISTRKEFHGGLMVGERQKVASAGFDYSAL